MEDNGQKHNSLDIVRLVAICAVILLHTVTGVLDGLSHQMSAGQISVYSSIKYLCEIGVPLFLMVSGALMLDPGRKLTWEKLHRKYIRRLVLALVIFGLIFAMGESIFKAFFSAGAGGGNSALKKSGFMSAGNGGVSVIAFLKLLSDSLKAVLTGDSWAHLWYMYVIIGIYLLLPLLRIFAEKAEEKIYGLVLLMLILFQSVIPLIEKLTEVQLELELPIKGIYLTYFLLGYYIVKYNPFGLRYNKTVHDGTLDIGQIPDDTELTENKEMDENRKTLYKAGILAAILAVLMAFSPEKTEISYHTPIVFIISAAVFVRILDNDSPNKASALGRKHSSFFLSIRSLSFGMYLVHTVFLNFCYKIIGITPLMFGGYILIPVIAAADFIFAYVAAWILKKLPWVGNNVV